MFFENKSKYAKYIAPALLIGVIVWVGFKLTHRPYLSFMVEYTDVPAINDGLFFFRIDVHYRGYDVGDVTKVQLAQDQQHIDFFVDINYKGLRIPSNSKIIFKTENIYGSRYLDIEAPKSPSEILIVDGDVINGVEAYERIDQYFIDEFKTGQTGSLIQDLHDIAQIVKKSLQDKENEKLLNQSAGDLAIILENLKEVTQDPTFKKDVKSTIKHSSGSLKSIDEILQREEMRNTINQAPDSIKKTLNAIQLMNGHMEEVSHMMPEANKNMAIASTLITEANGNLSAINSKVPPIPPSLVENAEKLIIKTDCMESELSKLLSKRGALLRLMFGNPAKSFRVCAKKGCKCLNAAVKK